MIETKGVKIFHVLNVLFMALITLICVYPMYYVIMASFSDSSLLMRHSGLLFIPLDFNMNAYMEILKTNSIVNGFINSVLVLVIGVSINMLLTIFAAYFFSRKDLILQKQLFVLVLVTMFFNGGLIPFYITVCNIGLYDTLWAVILPASVSTFNLIILKTAFSSIPESLIEAAKIDGANDFTILFKIVVPLSRATLAVIFLYYAVANWNSWFYASIFLRERSLYPLTLVLRQILLANSTDSMMGGASVEDFAGFSEVIKYAVICVATVPILIIYPFLQKYFVNGVMVGAVKG